MRKFIRKFLVFVLLLVLLVYPLDVLISYTLKNTTAFAGEYEVWNDIYDGSIHADVVVYGSSRAWQQIDPQILEDSLKMNAYNFGINGHNFWLQYLRHLEYLKYNRKPSLILLSVDVFSLEKRKELFNYQQFLPYMLWNHDVTQYTSSYAGFSYFDYKVPLIRYGSDPSIREAFRVEFLDPDQSYRSEGFKGLEQTWSSDLDSAKKRSQYYYVKQDSASSKLLRKFLDECKNDSIEVVFIYTPEHVEGQRYVANRQQITILFKEIATDYNLLFLDYSNHEMSFDKRYFYNASHFNATGAEKFSRILAHDIKVRKRKY